MGVIEVFDVVAVYANGQRERLTDLIGFYSDRERRGNGRYQILNRPHRVQYLEIESVSRASREDQLTITLTR